jgi:AraC family transcriptional regulator
MNSQTILANMARGWNRAPAGIASGSARTGLSTALWTHDRDDLQEVWAEPEPDVHLIAVTYGRFHCEKFIDGRLAFSKMLSSGLCNLVQAGARPRAVLKGKWRVVHLYLPVAWLDALVSAEDLPRPASALELINPKGRFDATVDRIAREVLTEMQDAQPLSRLRIDALGQDLAIRLLRAHSNFAGMRHRAIARAGAGDWRLRRAIDYLDAHMADDVGLAGLAAEVGLSEGHLAVSFRRATGLPPHRWLMRRRVERAQQLLKESRLSVTEIAHACGFASSQHLATVFKRHLGQTPSEHRLERRS